SVGGASVRPRHDPHDRASPQVEGNAGAACAASDTSPATDEAEQRQWAWHRGYAFGIVSSNAAARSDIILERLTTLHPKLIDLSLDRTWRILEALGHPERSLPPVFHVAGTNGKGSVCAMLRAMLEAGGYGVHSYTSPHLVRFHARIRLAGKPHSAFIEEEELAALLDECERANAGEPITFFEITTAAALLAFSRHPADALILEVGM